MTHTVRLESEQGFLVVAGTLPPFNVLPTVVLWGDRVFVLYEAGAGGHPSRYRERFTCVLIETTDVDPLKVPR